MIEQGLGSLGVTIAARYLGAPTYYLTNLPGPNPGTHWFVEPRTDMSAPFTFLFSGLLGAPPHFPYGYPVQPDAPV